MPMQEPGDFSSLTPERHIPSAQEQSCLEAELLVVNEAGLHLRVAMRIMEVAAKLPSDIQFATAETTANAKSMLDLLSLAAGPGTNIRVIVCGPEAEDSLRQLLSALSQEEFQIVRS